MEKVLQFSSMKQNKKNEQMLSDYSQFLRLSDNLSNEMYRFLESRDLFEVKSNDIDKVKLSRRITTELLLLMERIDMLVTSIQVVESSAEVIDISKARKKNKKESK